MECLVRLAVVLVASTTVSLAKAENWPSWRGPGGNGVSIEEGLPVEWDKEKNVRWRVDLPGPGNSSPIVWGDRVFVSQAVDDENRRTLMCFERASGDLLWQSGVTYTEDERTHRTNPYCAGTPATDGERVYVCLGSPGVFAYDLDGNEVWRRELGKLDHIFGTAVSPLVYGNLCVVNFGPGEGARLVALDKHTGEVVWEVEPPEVDPSELAPRGGRFGGFGGRGGRGGPGGPDGRGGSPRGGRGGFGGGRGGFANLGGSWSTPLVVEADGRDEVVVSFAGRLAAYDPASGDQLWISKGLGGAVYTTPLWGEGTLIAMTSGMGGGPAIAVKPGGNGDVTEDLVWKLDDVDAQIGSGVIHGNHFFTISQQGIAACFDRTSGDQVWQRRLPGSGGQGGSWSSMLLADGRIYVPNQAGDVFVLRAGPEYELLATNSVGEPTNASLAASDGDLILRTNSGLWCFSNSN